MKKEKGKKIKGQKESKERNMREKREGNSKSGTTGVKKSSKVREERSYSHTISARLMHFEAKPSESML